MVLYIGNEPIAGYSTNTKMNAHSLLDFKWSDHILNELSWVNADTFSWLSGDVYTAVYNKLVAEYDTGTTETETGVSYKKSDNGFKIADASQEQAVIDAYNSTGVAWFYILDTANRRFKLPRTKYNRYMSQVAVKGNGMTLGLTNGTVNAGLLYTTNDGNITIMQASAYNTNVGSVQYDNKTTCTNGTRMGITTDSTKSGMVADLSTDTNMLLYFYVGEFAQSAIEQTAGYAQTLTEKKADIDLANVLANIDFVVESKVPTADDPTWYRVYKSGWVEQGGIVDAAGGGAATVVTQIQLLKAYKDTSYSTIASMRGGTNHWASGAWNTAPSSTSTMVINRFNNSGTAATVPFSWQASGQGAN